MVYCDYKGFIVPEIIKKRPVVVIEKNRQNSKLVTVVPLSMTAPLPLQDYHVEMEIEFCSLHLGGEQSWVKCDLINTVSLNRLNLVKDKNTGERHAPNVGESFLQMIKSAVKIAHRL